MNKIILLGTKRKTRNKITMFARMSQVAWLNWSEGCIQGGLIMSRLSLSTGDRMNWTEGLVQGLLVRSLFHLLSMRCEGFGKCGLVMWRAGFSWDFTWSRGRFSALSGYHSSGFLGLFQLLLQLLHLQHELLHVGEKLLILQVQVLHASLWWGEGREEWEENGMT